MRQLSAKLRDMELGLATFADLRPGTHARAAHARAARGGRARRSARASTCSPSGSTIAPTTSSQLRPSRWPRSPPAPNASAYPAPSRVLSSDDPVRVFQQFAHVDLISGGRAEIMAGRGSFIESFPLFGYDLDDYDELFAEKLELLLRIREGRRSRGRDVTARRCARQACGHDRCRTRCPCGSPSAAVRSR